MKTNSSKPVLAREPEQRHQHSSGTTEAERRRKDQKHDAENREVMRSRCRAGLRAVIEGDQRRQPAKTSVGTKLDPYGAGNSGMPAAQK